MNKVTVTNINKKKKDNFFMIVFAISLLVLLVLGVSKAHEMGSINMGIHICDNYNLSLGINHYGEYVCYNPNEHEINYDFGINMGDIYYDT